MSKEQVVFYLEDQIHPDREMLKCRTCRGGGTISGVKANSLDPEAVKITCPNCGGVGKVKNPDYISPVKDERPTETERPEGYVTPAWAKPVTEMDCPTCGGHGSVKKTPGNPDGKCKTCAGSRHLQPYHFSESECITCGGNGIISQPDMSFKKCPERWCALNPKSRKGVRYHRIVLDIEQAASVVGGKV